MAKESCIFESAEEIRGTSIVFLQYEGNKDTLKLVESLKNEIRFHKEAGHGDEFNEMIRCRIFYRVKKSTVSFDYLRTYLAFEDEEFFNELNSIFSILHTEMYEKALESPRYFALLRSEIEDFNTQFFTLGYSLEDYDSAIKRAILKKITGWDGYWMIDFSESGEIIRVWGSGSSDWDAIYDEFFKEKPYPKIGWVVPTEENYKYKKNVISKLTKIRTMVSKDSNELRSNYMTAFADEMEVKYKIK